jgi:hypothetical protein
MESEMHRSLIGRSFVAVALVMLAPLPLRAGLITWGSATTISGDSDVVTTGTLVYAYNMGPSGVAATTVNGVTFVPFAVPATPTTSIVVGDVGLAESPDFLFGYDGFGSPFTPYSALSTPYKNLLGYLVFAGAPGRSR